MERPFDSHRAEASAFAPRHSSGAGDPSRQGTSTSGESPDLRKEVDENTQYTHILCIMATKTISIRVEAYEKLRRARLRPAESFSDVVMRAHWDEQTVTGGELLTQVRERGALYSVEDLDTIDEMKSEGKPPADKWSTP